MVGGRKGAGEMAPGGVYLYKCTIIAWLTLHGYARGVGLVLHGIAWT